MGGPSFAPPAGTSMSSSELDIGHYDQDDALCAEARESGRVGVSVYRVAEPLVVLGRGSKPHLELDVEACLADGLPVVRRRGGGCSVVLDAGNVIVSVAAPMSGFGDNKRYIEGISDWLIGGLSALGYEGVCRRGVSDIVWRERKVSGSCLHRAKDLLYYSASLLVDADLGLLERYLVHPPREPEYREGRRHGDFVGSLRCGRFPSARALEAALAEALSRPALEAIVCASDERC